MHIDTDYIRERKEESGVTWKYIAGQIGITPAALSQKMGGHMGWSVHDLYEMSRYLKCSLDRLVKP